MAECKLQLRHHGWPLYSPNSYFYIFMCSVLQPREVFKTRKIVNLSVSVSVDKSECFCSIFSSISTIWLSSDLICEINLELQMWILHNFTAESARAFK